MRLALVADLHGNFPATQAMEAELKTIGVDDIWFLGDAVGKGPSGDLCCDWVREHCSVCLGGNWDYGVGRKEFPNDCWHWDQLGPERLEWLASLPPETSLWMSGFHFRLFHGRPVTPLMKVQDSDVLLSAPFMQGAYNGVIFADSHRPFVRTLNEGYICNTGSVGNSLGVGMAHALLLEGEKNARQHASLRITVLSVPYDRERAIADCPVDMPHREEYIQELTTARYARVQG